MVNLILPSLALIKLADQFTSTFWFLRFHSFFLSTEVENFRQFSERVEKIFFLDANHDDPYSPKVQLLELKIDFITNLDC